MRVKIKARNFATGELQDVIIDPAKRHMLCMDFTPIDLEYLSRLPIMIAMRTHIGCIPFRAKTRVTGLEGKPVDIFADRTKGDWIAIEFTPEDLTILRGMPLGKDTRKIMYAGPKGKTDVQMRDIVKFKSEWPEVNTAFDDIDYEKLITKTIAKTSMANAFFEWSHEWPLNFHSTEHAPAPKIVLPDERTIEGKDG